MTRPGSPELPSVQQTQIANPGYFPYLSHQNPTPMRLLILLLVLQGHALFAQIDPLRITIARDQWGVPHIFAPTDAEVAYGFAWATAEDDFKTMQELLLPIRGVAGLVQGKEGAMLDVAAHLIGTKALVEARYEQDLSPAFRRILDAYAAGANAYAKSHPEEVLHRKLFPINGKDIIQAYVMGMTLMSGVDGVLSGILQGRYQKPAPSDARGSNAFAISRRKTTDGQTYLAINSHQPLEGVNSWYEAHLCSEEGWNILGATFAGGVSIFLGANEHLGWAHTLNYPDFADVYALEMHPEKKYTYRFDGQWLELEPYPTKAHIKLMGFLKVGAKQHFWQSRYGVTFDTPNGFFALRFPASRDIRAAEQWYRMNKATDFQSFRKALEMQGIVCTNIVYADRDDHIYYISNGRFPLRNPAFDWQGVLPGDTSATLWPDRYYPIDSLAQVFDPPSGYVYNCNHTPFLSSGPADNPDPARVPQTAGYQPLEDLTNRGARFDELIRRYDKLSYDNLKQIKFDRAYTKPLLAFPKLEPLFSLDSKEFPDVAEAINLLRDWDRVTSEDSEAASVYILAYRHIRSRLKDQESVRKGTELDQAKLVAGLRYANDYLKQHFGRTRVPLGELQRHTRGNVNLPYGGGPDVLAAVYSRPQENGQIRAIAGDSYIQLVRFGPEGVKIESINAFGASAKPESPHFTDQMELFTKQQLKPMTLDKATVLKEAKKIYHPGK